MFRKTLMLMTAVLGLAACMPGAARPLVEVAVVDRDTGEWLPQYPHRGDSWVAGTPGHRYGVRLTNTTGERVLVVLSVDGINAISGRTAHPSQTGYVLDPWETAEIAGWRKSLDDVAQFVFTDLADSYAARTGRPRNVGVIGVAVFRESRPHYYPPYPDPYPPIARESGQRGRDSAKSASAPAAAASERAVEDRAQGQSIGTGHGQREWAPVGTTDFVRASHSPAQVSEIRYDDSHRLMARGILPRHRPHHDHDPAPRAFPQGFVADPPGYRR